MENKGFDLYAFPNKREERRPSASSEITALPGAENDDGYFPAELKNHVVRFGDDGFTNEVLSDSEGVDPEEPSEESHFFYPVEQFFLRLKTKFSNTPDKTPPGVDVHEMNERVAEQASPIPRGSFRRSAATVRAGASNPSLDSFDPENTIAKSRLRRLLKRGSPLFYVFILVVFSFAYTTIMFTIDRHGVTGRIHFPEPASYNQSGEVSFLSARVGSAPENNTQEFNGSGDTVKRDTDYGPVDDEDFAFTRPFENTYETNDDTYANYDSLVQQRRKLLSSEDQYVYFGFGRRFPKNAEPDSSPPYIDYFDSLPSDSSELGSSSYVHQRFRRRLLSTSDTSALLPTLGVLLLSVLGSGSHIHPAVAPLGFVLVASSLPMSLGQGNPKRTFENQDVFSDSAMRRVLDDDIYTDEDLDTFSQLVDNLDCEVGAFSANQASSTVSLSYSYSVHIPVDNTFFDPRDLLENSTLPVFHFTCRYDQDLEDRGDYITRVEGGLHERWAPTEYTTHTRRNQRFVTLTPEQMAQGKKPQTCLRPFPRHRRTSPVKIRPRVASSRTLQPSIRPSQLHRFDMVSGLPPTSHPASAYRTQPRMSLLRHSEGTLTQPRSNRVRQAPFHSNLISSPEISSTTSRQEALDLLESATTSALWYSHPSSASETAFTAFPPLAAKATTLSDALSFVTCSAVSALFNIATTPLCLLALVKPSSAQSKHFFGGFDINDHPAYLRAKINADKVRAAAKFSMNNGRGGSGAIRALSPAEIRASPKFRGSTTGPIFVRDNSVPAAPVPVVEVMNSTMSVEVLPLGTSRDFIMSNLDKFPSEQVTDNPVVSTPSASTSTTVQTTTVTTYVSTLQPSTTPTTTPVPSTTPTTTVQPTTEFCGRPDLNFTLDTVCQAQYCNTNNIECVMFRSQTCQTVRPRNVLCSDMCRRSRTTGDLACERCSDTLSTCVVVSTGRKRRSTPTSSFSVQTFRPSVTVDYLNGIRDVQREPVTYLRYGSVVTELQLIETVAAIYYLDKKVCTGLLYDSTTVVTAAHCYPGGALDRIAICFANDATRCTTPLAFKIHGEFDTTQNKNDIMIFQISPQTTSLQFTVSNAQTLPTDCVVYARGEIDIDGNIDNNLKSSTVDYVNCPDYDACMSVTEMANVLPGDSGGPILCSGNTQIYGVVVAGWGPDHSLFVISAPDSLKRIVSKTQMLTRFKFEPHYGPFISVQYGLGWAEEGISCSGYYSERDDFHAAHTADTSSMLRQLCKDSPDPAACVYPNTDSANNKEFFSCPEQHCPGPDVDLGLTAYPGVFRGECFGPENPEGQFAEYALYQHLDLLAIGERPDDVDQFCGLPGSDFLTRTETTGWFCICDVPDYGVFFVRLGSCLQHSSTIGYLSDAAFSNSSRFVPDLNLYLDDHIVIQSDMARRYLISSYAEAPFSDNKHLLEFETSLSYLQTGCGHVLADIEDDCLLKSNADGSVRLAVLLTTLFRSSASADGIEIPIPVELINDTNLNGFNQKLSPTLLRNDILYSRKGQASTFRRPEILDVMRIPLEVQFAYQPLKIKIKDHFLQDATIDYLLPPSHTQLWATTGTTYVKVLHPTCDQILHQCQEIGYLPFDGYQVWSCDQVIKTYNRNYTRFTECFDDGTSLVLDNVILRKGKYGNTSTLLVRDGNVVHPVGRDNGFLHYENGVFIHSDGKHIEVRYASMERYKPVNHPHLFIYSLLEVHVGSAWAIIIPAICLLIALLLLLWSVRRVRDGVKTAVAIAATGGFLPSSVANRISSKGKLNSLSSLPALILILCFAVSLAVKDPVPPRDIHGKSHKSHTVDTDTFEQIAACEDGWMLGSDFVCGSALAGDKPFTAAQFRETVGGSTQLIDSSEEECDSEVCKCRFMHTEHSVALSQGVVVTLPLSCGRHMAHVSVRILGLYVEYEAEYIHSTAGYDTLIPEFLTKCINLQEFESQGLFESFQRVCEHSDGCLYSSKVSQYYGWNVCCPVYTAAVGVAIVEPNIDYSSLAHQFKLTRKSVSVEYCYLHANNYVHCGRSGLSSVVDDKIFFELTNFGLIPDGIDLTAFTQTRDSEEFLHHSCYQTHERPRTQGFPWDYVFHGFNATHHPWQVDFAALDPDFEFECNTCWFPTERKHASHCSYSTDRGFGSAGFNILKNQECPTADLPYRGILATNTNFSYVNTADGISIPALSFEALSTSEAIASFVVDIDIEVPSLLEDFKEAFTSVEISDCTVKAGTNARSTCYVSFTYAPNQLASFYLSLRSGNEHAHAVASFTVDEEHLKFPFSVSPLVSTKGNLNLKVEILAAGDVVWTVDHTVAIESAAVPSYESADPILHARSVESTRLENWSKSIWLWIGVAALAVVVPALVILFFMFVKRYMPMPKLHTNSLYCVLLGWLPAVVLVIAAGVLIYLFVVAPIIHSVHAVTHPIESILEPFNRGTKNGNVTVQHNLAWMSPTGFTSKGSKLSFIDCYNLVDSSSTYTYWNGYCILRGLNQHKMLAYGSDIIEYTTSAAVVAEVKYFGALMFVCLLACFWGKNDLNDNTAGLILYAKREDANTATVLKKITKLVAEAYDALLRRPRVGTRNKLLLKLFKSAGLKFSPLEFSKNHIKSYVIGPPGKGGNQKVVMTIEFSCTDVPEGYVLQDKNIKCEQTAKEGETLMIEVPKWTKTTMTKGQLATMKQQEKLKHVWKFQNLMPKALITPKTFLFFTQLDGITVFNTTNIRTFMATLAAYNSIVTVQLFALLIDHAIDSDIAVAKLMRGKDLVKHPTRHADLDDMYTKKFYCNWKPVTQEHLNTLYNKMMRQMHKRVPVLLHITGLKGSTDTDIYGLDRDILTRKTDAAPPRTAEDKQVGKFTDLADLTIKCEAEAAKNKPKPPDGVSISFDRTDKHLWFNPDINAFQDKPYVVGEDPMTDADVKRWRKHLAEGAPFFGKPDDK